MLLQEARVQVLHQARRPTKAGKEDDKEKEMKINKQDNDWFFNRDFDKITPKSVFKAWLAVAFVGLVFWLVVIAAVFFGLNAVL